MTSRRKYKLYYFDTRGRGELIRLLFTYAGVQFEDIRISRQEWPQLKPAVPMGQLPVLEIDGVMYCQSMAIARLIAKEYALAGSNSLEMARADMLVAGIDDTLKRMRPVFEAKFGGDQEQVEQKWREFKSDHLKPFLSRYEHVLESNKDSSFLIGQSITWADIALADFLSQCQDIGQDDGVLADYPMLTALQRLVFSLPRVKEYVEKRTK